MDTKRQMQLGEHIKRNLAIILQEKGFYLFKDAMVTVTSVKVAADLSQAKVYLSIFNTDDKNTTLTSIQNHTHVIKQSLVSKLKNIRKIPQIYFYLDDTVDELYKVNALFDHISATYIPYKPSEEDEV